MSKVRLTLTVAAAAMIAATAQGHHSAAMFDRAQTITLKGTFHSQVYANPHVWISIIGSPDGKGPEARWDVETVGPGSLARIGIVKDTLKVGDKLTVVINPLRDGRNGGSLVSITTPDGKVRGWTPEDGKGTAPQ